MKLKHLSEYSTVKRDPIINPVALKEIREILEGIKNGTLLHNQKNFHTPYPCGTAHCVAGWKVHNDALKAGLTPKYSEHSNAYSSELDKFMYSRALTRNEWDYAMIQWDLNSDETHYLFNDNATLDEQFELLEVLEAGLTLV